MSSEESSKMSKQTRSRDLLSSTEWLDEVYNELLEAHNDADADPGWELIWDKDYARRQELRQSQSRPDATDSGDD
jgi:hypothetical protein